MICLSDNINVKQLRTEVQLLRDELAIMKRKYEDIIYNLDTDNFSSRFVKEQGDMRTAIEVTAEGIKTKVSNEEFQSAMTQTAEKIETEVSNLDNTLSTRISQNAEEISLEAQARAEADSALNSKISVTANGITSRVSNLETFKESVFTQTEYGFTLDGEQTTFTGVIYLTDNDGDKRFSFFHDESQGYEQVILHSWTNDDIPIVLGSIGTVYIGSCADGYQVATRDWVLENAGSASGTVVAVFG